MYKLKRHLPIKTRLQIYQSLVQSHLNYCSLVWGFASKAHIETLFRKQKIALRAIMPGYINYNYKDGVIPTHTKSSFFKYNILTVHSIIVKNALLPMHKINHFPNLVPQSVRDIFPSNMPLKGASHESSQLWYEIYGGSKYKNTVFYKGPLLFISPINSDITTLSSLLSVKCKYL